MLGLALQNRLQIKCQRIPQRFYYIDFDGDDDKLGFSTSFNSYIDGSKDFSMSAWVRKDGESTGTIFATGHITGNNNFRLQAKSDETLQVTFKNTEISVSSNAMVSTGTLTIGEWAHIGMTHDEGADEFKIYISGSLDSTHSLALTHPVYDHNASIGTLSEGLFQEHHGGIANFALFNDVLTAGEMQSLGNDINYDATKLSNCVGWWRMGAGTENGTGTTIYDMSTNSNNGTLGDDPEIKIGVTTW